MRIPIFIIVLLLIFSGCQPNNIMQQLTSIDKIAETEGNERALSMLNAISPEAINDEECLAFYWLLKMRTEIRLNKKIQSAQPLEISINFYKTNLNRGKLARAYGYKASILENHGDYKDAVLALKEAESLIKDDSNEIKLLQYIYHTLALINQKAKENKLSLEYSKLALKTAYKLEDDYEIAYSLMSMYVSYNDINNRDSAIYYLNKSIPYIEKIPKKERVNFYNNIGLLFMEEDCESAEKFLMMAYNINPNAYTYKGLASIYQIRGEKEKAHEMWGKALQTDNKRLKVEVLQTLYDIQRDEGDYKKASETAMQIVALKDSIAQREKEENIRGIQEQYEIEHQAMAEKARTNMIIYLTASLLFLAVALATYLYYRMTKGRQELKEVRKQLEQHRLQLKVLEQEGKTDTKEVENLKQKISELQTKQGALLQNGRERYEEMMAGGTTIRWSRNDFMDAVEYYRTVDADFINHMEQDYKHLSSKYIFFSLLEHLGKTDEELQHIMAISQNTIRSYRSRINHSLIQG